MNAPELRSNTIRNSEDLPGHPWDEFILLLLQHGGKLGYKFFAELAKAYTPKETEKQHALTGTRPNFADVLYPWVERMYAQRVIDDEGSLKMRRWLSDLEIEQQ